MLCLLASGVICGGSVWLRQGFKDDPLAHAQAGPCTPSVHLGEQFLPFFEETVDLL